MPLSDLVFSDLLLFPDGSAKLKGCPGTGAQLVSVSEDCAEELNGLPLALAEAAMQRQEPNLRFKHGGVHYRVASANDVQLGERIWFMRRLPEVVPEFASLGLPDWLVSWLLASRQSQGLVLVAGAQASGKTTAASSFVAERLKIYGGHGVTFENPAELPLSGPWGEGGYCFQTEISSEQDLPPAIERAHRYAAPDIIFIGEIRTKYAALECLRVALGSNRQIVVATIHGLDLIAALERLIGWARELDGDSAGHNLADALLAAVHLTLEDNGHGGLTLQYPKQFLLLPFSGGGNELVPAMRSKLRERQFHTLAQDMNQMRARIANEGDRSI